MSLLTSCAAESASGSSKIPGCTYRKRRNQPTNQHLCGGINQLIRIFARQSINQSASLWWNQPTNQHHVLIKRGDGFILYLHETCSAVVDELRSSRLQRLNRQFYVSLPRPSTDGLQLVIAACEGTREIPCKGRKTKENTPKYFQYDARIPV